MHPSQVSILGNQSPAAAEAAFVPRWGDEAPKGGRTVLNRMIKEGANVPLFLGQTLIHSLRNLGYNDPTSCVCEHVDNAVQWGATEVRVYFHQTGKKGGYRVDALVYDNGIGMSPTVLRAAMAFGGSMCFDNRSGIGRYGVGMKGAALGMGPVLDVYSWQEPGVIYNMTLDVDEIGNDKSNVVNLPEPGLTSLPAEVRAILTSPMVYPKNPQETQDLLEDEPSRLVERLGASGTIVYMPKCDRLPRSTAQPLVDHAVKEMARIYRRHLAAGLKLYINNRRVHAFDPNYWQEGARHARFVEELAEQRSRLVNTWTIAVPTEDGSPVTKDIQVRLYRLPIAEWEQLPYKVQKNDLRLFEHKGISFVRNSREVHMGWMNSILGRIGTRDSWWRLEVDFPAELDEAFGVAVNKQGVRPHGYVCDLVKKAVKDDLRLVRMSIDQHWAEKAAMAKQAKGQPTEAERRATEADPFQATVLPQPSPRTPEEQRQLEENLRALAIGLKREGESDDEAYERVKNSRYFTITDHNEDLPFYRVDFRLGKVILRINSAHPFFKHLYEPLSLLAQHASTIDFGGEEGELDSDLADRLTQALVNLQLLLMSLARTQSEMTVHDDSGERQRTFDTLRKQWSMNLATLLTVS